MKPPAARSSPRTGLRRPRRIAGLPVRRALRTRGKQLATRYGWRSAGPAHGADVTDLMRMTGWRRTRLDRHRREDAEAGGVSGQRGTLARAQARGAVTVSDRPGVVPSRASRARLPVTRVHGRRDGRTGRARTWHPRQPLSDQERAAIQQAGADDARRSRAEHGFPERIEDPAAVAVLAALLRGGRAPPRNERGRRKSAPAA